MPPADLKEPWRSFLVEIDRRLEKPLELHCLGGFVSRPEEADLKVCATYEGRLR